MIRPLRILLVVLSVTLFNVLNVNYSPTLLAAEIIYNDADITRAIEEELIIDESVSPHLIDVNTEEGIVTLTGSVATILEKDRAQNIAESIRGVKAVINSLQVRAIQRDDEEIRRDIKNALALDPAADTYEIDVEVSNGVVTLSGAVESWAERRLSETVAKGVKGVERIINTISIEYQEQRADAEIEADIKRTLKSDVYVDEEMINVDVSNGVVMLKGTVGSVAAKTAATNDSWVLGVNEVNNEDLVVDVTMEDRVYKRREWVERLDEEIEDDIEAALEDDPRVNAMNISIIVENNIAILNGTVNSIRAKNRAQQIAEMIKGVLYVKNNIKVRLEEPLPDTIIAQNIKNAFLWDPYVDRYDISVYVLNNRAYLTGNVNTYYERQRAENIAYGILGVVDVNNNITVDYSWTWSSDSEIENNIEGQLFWSIFVDSYDISVTVNNGVATLYGVVDSWSELHNAVKNAFDGGAHIVKSRLRLFQGRSLRPLKVDRTYYTRP